MTKERALTIGMWAQVLTMAVGFLCSWIMLIAYDTLGNLETKIERMRLDLQEIHAQQLAMRTRLDYHEKADQ